MGTTAGGIVYPDATDPVDITGDLQALAESVEAEFKTGSSWSTSTTGFTLAANWTALTVRYRTIGPWVDLYLAMDRATSAITVAAGTGNIADVDVLSAVPAALLPAGNTVGMAGTVGRLCQMWMSSAGVVKLSAVAGDGTNIAIGEGLAQRFLYPLG
jgi:hypothetical protein